MITDEQIRELTERPSLRERAKQAAIRAARAETDRLNSEYAMLEQDALEFMHDTLGMTMGEIAEVDFQRGMMNPLRPHCEFTVEGIEFRLRNRTEAINITRNGEKECVGHELVLVAEFRFPPGDWKELDADDADGKLAQIGMMTGAE